MSVKRIMEQIRDHLSHGRTSREVIDLGYAAGSVYKVQRKLRQAKNAESTKGASQHIPAGLAPIDPATTAKTSEVETEISLARLLEESDEEDEWPNSPQLEHKLLRESVDRVEELTQSLSESTQEIQEQARRIKNIEHQSEALTRTQAAQDKQIAIWTESHNGSSGMCWRRQVHPRCFSTSR